MTPAPLRSHLVLVPAAALLLIPLPAHALGGDGACSKQEEAAGATCTEAAAEPLCSEGRARLAALFDGLLAWEVVAAPAADACTEGAAAAQGCPIQALGSFVLATPGAWDELGPMIHARFEADSATPGERARLLDFLAWTACPRALEVGTELWASRSASFSDDQVLAFAERGGEPFHAELRQRAAARAEEGSPLGFYPAAFLALRGWENVRGELAPALDAQAADADALQRAFVAGAALERLGDRHAWKRALTTGHGAVIAALDADRPEEAARLASVVELFCEMREAYPVLPVSFLADRRADYVAKRAPQLASAAEVFELIEKVAPY